jgi:hypothetical protein
MSVSPEDTATTTPSRVSEKAKSKLYSSRVECRNLNQVSATLGDLLSVSAEATKRRLSIAMVIKRLT